MAATMRVFGKRLELITADGVIAAPARLTHPWWLLAHLAIPSIEPAEVPVPSSRAADAAIRPAVAAKLFLAAHERSASLARAGRPEAGANALGAPSEVIRHDLHISASQLANVRADANEILVRAGHNPIPGGRGLLALPELRTDLDDCFDLLAAGDYEAALQRIRVPSGIPEILEGHLALWLAPARLLLARAIDGVLAGLAADARNTHRPALLQRAADRTAERAQLVDRVLGDGDTARGHRVAALARLRDGHLRRLRATQDRSPPSGPEVPVRRSVPEPVSSFVGRRREMSQLSALIRTQRLITLTGPGGVGKSRLASRLARSTTDLFGDGVAIVELAPVTDSRLLLTTLASALDVTSDVGASAEEVAAAVGDDHRLLVLDNCEHVVGPVAGPIDLLLDRCPHLVVAATSRESLGLRGETVYEDYRFRPRVPTTSRKSRHVKPFSYSSSGPPRSVPRSR
jgi:hypothetical protein